MRSLSAIADMVPHAGTMVLLDEVVTWNLEEILCRTSSHLRPDNPLRRDGMLSATASCEYAAQAAAVHGALNEGGVSRGFLAALKDFQLFVDDLAQIRTPILVSATRLMADPAALIYGFRLYGDAPDGADIAAGRLTVKLLESEAP
ncbi:MAG: hypothetical protein JJ878_13280 [Alphaproteobacteria bacterium]|nr:hypothetical protein [Alphaproteobacteria bacterium]MBO6863605.1 hypothetical protein [Alphaproteobacteria bacterium]